MIMLASAAIVVVATVIFTFVLFAGPLGLGIAEEFVLYRWAGVPRREAAQWSTAVAGLGLATAVITLVQALPGGRRLLMQQAANLGLVLSSTAVGLVLLEGVARSIDGVSLWSFENHLAKKQALLTVHAANQYDPVLGWVLASGLRINPDDPKSSMTTGDFGIRMNQAAIRPIPTGGVLAVGDSFTAGSEVGDRDSWPAQLERLIGEPVVNGATGAWASDQIVLRAEQLLPIVRPRTVLAILFDDDINRAGYRVYAGAQKPWFTVDDGRLVHHNQPVPRFEGRPDEVGAPILGYSHLVSFVMERLGYGDWWRRANTSYVRADNDPVAVTCRLLERLHATAAKAGARLLLGLIYAHYDRLHLAQQPVEAQAVADCARAAGIQVVDFRTALTDIARSDPERYHALYVKQADGKTYGHLSPQGNGLVAKSIRDILGQGH